MSQDWTNNLGKKAPNILTFLRILVVPVFVFLLANPNPKSSLWAAIIFIFASLTDWLDGYIARLYKAESILGTMLDPLADKILVTAALVMLAAVPDKGRVEAWIVVVLLSREFLVTGLRSLAAVKGMVVPASRVAKHKTAWTFVAIILLLIDASCSFGVINFHFLGTIAIWVAMFLSVGSGIHYAVSLRKLFL